jgi:hypothetical protein
MKKIATVFLIIVYIVFALTPKNFSNAQIIVFDPAVFGALLIVNLHLAKILSVMDGFFPIFEDEFKKINNTLSATLETRFEEQFNKLFTDTLKEEEFQEYAVNLLKFIRKRQDKAQNPDEYISGKKFIKEARLAGAYQGLIRIPNIISCIKPNLRLGLLNHTLNLTEYFDLREKTIEIFEQIPDCEVPQNPTEISFKPKSNFFTWLTEPFKLNIAQISASLSSEEEIPPITITTAFEKTEDSITLNDLESIVDSSILGQALASENTMKTRLTGPAGNDYCPTNYFEYDEGKHVCLRPLAVMNCVDGTYLDEGKFLCLKYETLITGEQMVELRQKLLSNNTLYQTINDINIFQKFLQSQDIIKKIGLATSSPIATSTEFIGVFTNREEIRKIIDKTCSNYALNYEKNNPTAAYALCLKQFQTKLATYSEIIQKKVEERKKQAEETKNIIDLTKSRAESLKGFLPSCPTAYSDLEEITQELDAKSQFYNQVIARISNVLSQITSLRFEINNLGLQIEDLINSIFQQTLDVVNIINQILNIIGSILALMGVDISIIINGLTQIKAVMNALEKIKDDIISMVRRIIGIFNNIISLFANIIAMFNQLVYNLFKIDFTQADVLDDIYTLQYINQKLDAYERLIKKGATCAKSPQEATTISSSNVKPIVVVTENPKPKAKFINLLSLVKNLFQPKLVEIQNEK